ncbi:MAG TPA: carboxypeptidase regulatory-like domain-containing protein [Pyrinomonadaceae bacterium]|nr:carboxypeptidase regulatory-like domain-containing protein [Pyrinomonadaceae bacterium]
MRKFSNIRIVALLLAFAAAFASAATAQVTTSEMTGTVTDQAGAVVSGATVTAVHGPSGTKYSTVTNGQGRFTIPAMRIGGPYTVTVTSSGFQEQKREGLNLALGNSATVDFTIGVQETNVEVTVSSDATFNEARTGAATNIGREVLETLPTIGRQITDFTRLTPQAGSNGSFAGADPRMNNITIDGTYFNNSFGLRNAPGLTSGVSPIPLDAIEEVQVNVAPYDVRQGNFVGAGVNTVTRSGTNKYTGSAYYLWRGPGLLGKEIGDTTINRGNFKYRNWGFTAGGPIPFFNFGDGADDKWYTTGKDRLFFFFSYENEETSSPATTFRANNGGERAEGNVTRVLKSDLDTLSNFLRTNFGYETGPYADYSFLTPGKKYLGRVDYNINTQNKINFRYLQLDSSTDNPLSSSSSLANGRPNGSVNFLSYQNSTYSILENIRSFQGEWTSMFTPTVSNSLLMGYTKQDESRGFKGEMFPFVDILEGGQTYTSFGFEPFTPNNELRYNTVQIQDNITFYRGHHTITAGGSYEHYTSENVFFPGSQSAYVYNSLADFYTDANGYLANPNRVVAPIALKRFQVRYSNVPGLDKPLQPLEVDYIGFYGQDVWKLRDNLSLTFGARGDVPFFGDTGFTNPLANALDFRGRDGGIANYETQKLPDATIRWSPRVGFNWAPFERLQVRGGTGVFTGKPAYVWISNQIGNNGILTGFEDINITGGTTSRPFNPDVNHYKPTNVTGAPAPTYELNFTEPNFSFPQIWRTNIGADVRVPLGLVAGAEYIYSRDVNGMYYINANLPAANTKFNGPDDRPRWTGASCTININLPGDDLNPCSNRLYKKISGAYVLQNQSEGTAWNLAFSLEKPYAKGFYAKVGYSYGENKNLFDPGSVASGSWTGNGHYADPNNPAMGFAANSPGHRYFGTASYRIEYFKFGATTISGFWETRTWGNTSYLYSGDRNGDGSTNNDLIYIPKDTSEMNFEQYTASGKTFTVADQQAAFEQFIQADSYLSKHRGEYAQRFAAFLPLVTKVDVSLRQEFFVKTGSRVHRFQLSANMLNFGNWLNKEWGGGKAFTSNQILVPSSVNAGGVAQYRLRNNGPNLISSPYLNTAGTNDVWRLQFGVKYIFN